MGIYGGLKREDWTHWGQFTTFKSNAAELLHKSLHANQTIYCSPLVDPYQPAETARQLMPAILDALIENPPLVFTIQTRGPSIVRDLERLIALSRRTRLRVSFSLTTNREEIRKIYEPHCVSLSERLSAIEQLRAAGIVTFATLAPILPCDPEEFAAIALNATTENIIADPLHVRAVKKHGATTRQAAVEISVRREFSAWLEPQFQAEVLARIQAVVVKAGRRCAAGTEGFAWLAK
jgi:DNA repair photolyase